ncbi:two pore domain potassium channel family protein [Thermaurantiacus tibetensis]|uniref:two pore domain potassium channel family protein n=1 Tax=Thermaurantiacus tibetensis TaxID=2759035 RepID=UPI00188F0041|nr:two pore domain potassium channel family protein [Thermaurantiacus tibetensis]
MTENLPLQLLVSGVLVLATVAIHAVGLILLSRLLRREAREEVERHIRPLSLEGVTMVVALVAGLFLVHGLEILLYALLFLGAGAVPTLADAIFFSAMTYGTVGYSDALLDPALRLVAAVEGINGLLLIGWSTAFFVTLMGRLIR